MSDIIDKIRKLLRLANNNPNLNESLAAAAMAQNLMDKHRLTYEIVMGEDFENPYFQEKPIDYAVEYGFPFTPLTNPNDWIKILMKVIAEHNHCKIYIKNFFTRNKEDGILVFKGFSIIGKISDIKMVDTLFFWIFAEILRIERSEPESNKTEEWVENYRIGAVNNLSKRFKDLEKERIVEGFTKDQIKNALVRIDANKSKVEEMFNDLNSRLGKGNKPTIGDNIAFLRGYNAASKIELSQKKSLSGEGKILLDAGDKVKQIKSEN